MQKRLLSAVLAVALLLSLVSCAGTRVEAVDYGDRQNWAVWEPDKAARADVFFVCPTVYGGAQDSYNMPLDDDESRAAFLGATKMEQGIYDADARFFAPYYRQAGLNAYTLSEQARAPYLASAYADVKAEFQYYLDTENDGRPIILAGFSQGADLCLRLLKEFFSDEQLNARLVACYAIGWRITQAELAAYPHLRFAAGEDDVGVIVSFNSEAEAVTDSLLISAGVKTLAINPLNWKTDSTPADRDETLGACFTNYDGEIETETPGLCGAYIDPERGALKVTGVSPADYPAGLSIFEDGVYHLYDYQFFYRNLQQNVAVRLDAYCSAR